MKILNAQKIGGGVAIGKLFLLSDQTLGTKEKLSSSPFLPFSPSSPFSPSEAAIHEDKSQEDRLKEAIAQVQSNLQRLIEDGWGTVGCEIFSVHQMMLEDPDFQASLYQELATGSKAEQAVERSCLLFASRLEQTGDLYLAQRATDVFEIGESLQAALRGDFGNSSSQKLPKGCIVVAEDLLASRVATLLREGVAGVILTGGSQTSHVAILLRALSIPSVCTVQREILTFQGMECGLDAEEGKIYLEPDEQQKIALKQLAALAEESKQSEKEWVGKETVTSRGEKIALLANLSGLSELPEAVQADSEGIGLFRTEFLFMQENPPDEEEQLQVYKTVLKAFPHRPVVIRTLDLGADKRPPWSEKLWQEREENPAMGMRGIRLCLQHPELFYPQLRALLRAAAEGEGQLHVMLPLVNLREEIVAVKKILRQLEEELEKDRLAYQPFPLGIMIETPIAALSAEELAEEAEFFSIGTNDLMQYLFAADRQNGELSDCQDAYHPAFRKLLASVCRAAQAKGRWVGICGELAGEERLFPDFLSWGVKELSLSYPKILSTRAKIRTL
jgi:phosphotransferase system enzyme I (PtsI)